MIKEKEASLYNLAGRPNICITSHSWAVNDT